MQNDTVLQKFLKFKSMIASADVPCDVLMEMIESYITSDDSEEVAESIPVLEGQLSLSDYKYCA